MLTVRHVDGRQRRATGRISGHKRLRYQTYGSPLFGSWLWNEYGPTPEFTDMKCPGVECFKPRAVPD
jgi:hypothetical protein